MILLLCFFVQHHNVQKLTLLLLISNLTDHHQAKKIHPDKNTASNSTEAFKAIQAVYEILSCPQKRADHDRKIEAREASAEFQRQRENQRLRAKVEAEKAEKKRLEREVKAAMNAKRTAEKRAAKEVKAAITRASEEVKEAMKAKTAAEKRAAKEVKIEMKQASEEVKAAMKAKKEAEKETVKKSVGSKKQADGRSKSAPRLRTATAWEEFAPGTTQYNTIPPGTQVRAYAHAWRGGLAFTRNYYSGQVQSFNIQSGHYIVMLDASEHSNGKNNIVAVDPTDIFQIIKVQTRFRQVWVTSYDADSSTYQVMWISSEGSTRTANIGHYDFIIPNGTVVRLEDIPNDEYAWMNGKYGQIIRWREGNGTDRSRYVVRLSSTQSIPVHMYQVRL